MLIEQNIEFEVRGHGPLGRICIPTAGYFYDKTKILRNIFELVISLFLKYRRRQCTLLPPAWIKSVICLSYTNLLNTTTN